MASLQDCFRYCWHLVFFVSSNIYTFFAYISFMTLLTPLKHLAPKVYWKIDKELFYWLLTVCATWIDFGGYKVIECGDNLDALKGEECLLISNHQSTGDVPIVALSLLNSKSNACSVMWVIFKDFRYTNFGILCGKRKDFFIDVGKSVRDSELSRFKKHLLSTYLPLKRKWLVIFPEGGYLSRQKETNLRFAKKYNLPELDHLLLPRVGAVKVVLDTVGESYQAISDASLSSLGDKSEEKTNESLQLKDGKENNAAGTSHSDEKDPSHPVKWIIDMTIAYKDKQPLELLGMSIGYAPPKDALVHWRAFRVRDIPRDEASLTTWLYDRYQEKEAMLDAYYKEGKLPGPSNNPLFPPKQPGYFKFDRLQQILVHVALVTLFYLQYAMIFKPVLGLVSFVFNSVFQSIF